MKNKFKLLAGFIIICCTGLAQAQSTVTLSGHIKNAGNMVIVNDFSEFELINRPAPEHTFIPDSNGNFTITFKLTAPNYFRIARNKLYLTPGDNIKCEIDGKNQEFGQFSGVGGEACNYLTHVPFPKAGSYISAARYLYQSPVITMDTIIIHATESKKELAQLKNVSAEFKKMEAVRIDCDLLNSISGAQTYIPFFNLATRGQSNEDFNRTMRAIAAPVLDANPIPMDASLLKIEVYRDIIADLVKNKPVTEEVQKIQDWLTASKIVREMDKISDKKNLSAFESSVAAIKTPLYRQAAQNHLKAIQDFGKGDFAVDVTCINNGLKRVLLSSLRGKVIYVDLWATWCGPCLAEMPAYEALKLKYKDNPNVAFVSISIDDESKYKDWLKNLEDRKATGNQWQINVNNLNAYNINGIPRTIIIDKDFKIADMNAPLPSSKILPAQLDKLLKM
jgi:thiol-disulfide isomerase/thioredoxin